MQELNTAAYRLIAGRISCASSGRVRRGMISFFVDGTKKHSWTGNVSAIN